MIRLGRGGRRNRPTSRPDTSAHIPRSGSAVTLTEVHRRYTDGGRSVAALDGVSLEVARGSFLAVMGPSGSGKSTLLNCAAGMEPVTSGSVAIGGHDIGHLSETARTRFRRERVGFVFQDYNLVPTLTAADNITLPLRLAGRLPDHTWLRDLVGRMGIADRLGHRPSELSGGQQQRVAIVRALAARPDIVFADEPTGALDASGARRVLRLLAEIVEELHQTVVLVTHDPKGAAHAQATAVMVDGRIAETLSGPGPATLAQRLASLEGRPDHADTA